MLSDQRSRLPRRPRRHRGVSNENLRRVPGHGRQAQAVREPLFRAHVKRHGCGRTLRLEPCKLGIEVQVSTHRIVFHCEPAGRLDHAGYGVPVKRNAVYIRIGNLCSIQRKVRFPFGGDPAAFSAAATPGGPSAPAPVVWCVQRRKTPW